MDIWAVKLQTSKEKKTFVIEMLKQMILALKTLHSLGYSHGDLKPTNICARKSRDGSIKFTLIDLGMSAKLIKLGDNRTKGRF